MAGIKQVCANANPVLDDPDLAVVVPETVACVRCGGGVSGPHAIRTALAIGMLRTLGGWIHAECLAKGED